MKRVDLKPLFLLQDHYNIYGGQQLGTYPRTGSPGFYLNYYYPLYAQTQATSGPTMHPRMIQYPYFSRALGLMPLPPTPTQSLATIGNLSQFSVLACVNSWYNVIFSWHNVDPPQWTSIHAAGASAGEVLGGGSRGEPAVTTDQKSSQTWAKPNQNQNYTHVCPVNYMKKWGSYEQQQHM